MTQPGPGVPHRQQLVEPLTARGLSREAATDRALELLDRVGIPDPKRTFAAYPHQICGGMAQRVLIAGAISGDPDLLIADEPTTALDVTVQAEVLDAAAGPADGTATWRCSSSRTTSASSPTSATRRR